MPPGTQELWVYGSLCEVNRRCVGVGGSVSKTNIIRLWIVRETDDYRRANTTRLTDIAPFGTKLIDKQGQTMRSHRH